MIARVAVLATLLVVALLVVPITEPLTLSLLGVPLLLATIGAGWSRSMPALRMVLLADFWYATIWLGGIAIWPVPVFVGLLLLWMAGSRWPALLPVASWAVRGRWTPDLPWLVLATAVLSVAALVAWTLATGPSVSAYLAWIAAAPAWQAVPGIAEVWGAVTAVISTGLAFGIAHFNGFPSGPVGAAMAAVYGIALGILRVRSRGMLAPFVAHVVADTAICLLAVLVLS